MEKSNREVEKLKRKKISKTARLIVRNLSFQVTEEKFRKHFSSCGEIKEINILKKPNGKLVGCGFVQYARVPDAAKAIRELNLKPFMSRPIAVDWALSKEKFQGKQNVVKPESEIKEEAADAAIDTTVIIKEEVLDDDLDIKNDLDDELYQDREKSLKRGLDNESDSESDESSSKLTQEDTHKRRKITNDDADEGKTLFLRNLEFETTQEKLKEFFENFGPLCYAVLCKDRLTEYPKGTAFVKFQKQLDMEKCLSKFDSDPSHFLLGRRQFIISEALSKNKLGEKLQNATKKEPKDKRNLFLAREGFIRPESEAAAGLSLNDNNKRTFLHRSKKQLLRNLHIFVSDIRLCVHNLPSQFTDKNLRKLFIRYGGKGAHVTEAKIMRDMSNVDASGLGQSKEFGFVTFTKHESALHALRAINNNPTIFTPKTRPIVEFSLENRKALQAKEKRAEKSREKNNNNHKLSSDAKDGSTTSQNKRQSRQMKPDETPGNEESRAEKSYPRQQKKHEELPNYSGLTAKFGVSTLPSLKAKGKITRKSLKPLKHQKKRSQPERRMREPKSRPQVTKSREDQVDKLVTRYKQRTVGEQQTSKPTNKKKKKWFK